MAGSETDFFQTQEEREANLTAIYNYVREQRTQIHEYPDVLPLIESFESWYQGLGWYDKGLGIGATTDEARRRKAAINAALERKIPDDWVPADRPQTPPPEEKPLVPDVPLKWKIVAGVVGLATLGLVGARVTDSITNLKKAVSGR
jgi:hypothetical protein